MSDDKDPSPPPDGSPVADRIDEARRRLETAFADYLEASAESQRALRRVVDEFSDLSKTLQQAVQIAESTCAQRPDAELYELEELEEPEPTDQADDGGDPTDGEDDEPTSPVIDESSPTSPNGGGDHSQNALPAHLHSRGIAIPDQATSSQPSSAPAPAATTARQQTRSDIERPRLVEAAVDEPRQFSGLRNDSNILLTNDGFGVAPVLNEILSSEGFRVRIDSRRPELSAPADTVIFLGGLRAPSDLDDAMSIVDDAMHTAERLTTRLMQPDSAFLAAIDTAGGFGIDAFDPVAAPLGALLGLVRLLDRRHPGADTKLVDIDGGKLSGRHIAELLAEELLEGGDTTPVAISGQQRRTVQWKPFAQRTHPASWLEDQAPPLVYMPGPDGVLATAVERLAIAHELPVAVLRRRHAPAKLADHFDELGIDTRSADYDLNRLFSVMDFLDTIRDDYGPIAAVVTESMTAKKPDELVNWEVMRGPLDEFNALLAMTINDPLRLLGVGIGPGTPPVISSALRYFARAESLRRNDHMQVRLAHLVGSSHRDTDALDPHNFAITEFLAGAEPPMGEVRFDES